MPDEVLSSEGSSSPSMEGSSTPDSSTDSQNTSQDTGSQLDSQSTPEVSEAYSPNLSFKVHEEEKQIDEWLKPAITDAEREKKVREIYEKAYGLDHVKPKYEKMKGEYETTSKEVQRYNNIVENLRTDVKNDDYDSFLERLNIPQAKIFEWVAKKLQYEDLPPEQKRRYDSEISERRRNADLMRENQQLQTSLGQGEVQRLTVELNGILAKPEVNSTMREFDQSQGRVGAFREQIAYHAIAMQQMTGRDPTAEDAVKSLLTLMGRGQAGQPTPPNASQPGDVVTNSKPVIPNIKAKGGTPVVQKPKTIDELRKKANARIAELNR